MASTGQMDYARLRNILDTLRKAQTDLQNIEVKEAAGGVPKTLADSISALTNGSGGIVILGLSERNGFIPAEGFSAKNAMNALADICSNKLTPPVRAQISIEQVDNSNIVVAEIPETAPQDKPCYVNAKGMYKGSFIRTGDGDRLLTTYEINRLAEERQQPRYDDEIVDGATLADLDTELLDGVIKQQRFLHPRIFGNLSKERLLEALGITKKTTEGKQGITLAGLLALGVYPQHFEPRLTVAFTRYPGAEQAFTGPNKYTETRTIVGSIPYLILDSIAAVNEGLGLRAEAGGGASAEDIQSSDDKARASKSSVHFPSTVVREVVCNALMHRDYSLMGRGMQVQVNLYADRLEVISPGGLYGAVTKDTMGETGISATRNLTLAALLETTPYPEGGFVAENNSGGMKRLSDELKAAGFPAPEVVDKPSYLKVILRAHSVAGMQDGVEQQAASQTDNTGSLAVGSFEQLGKEMPYLNGSTLSVYKVFYQHKYVRTSDIVEATGIPRSTVCFALKNLVKQGLIEVAGEDVARNSPQRRYKLAG